jgi:hypothetical protein
MKNVKLIFWIIFYVLILKIKKKLMYFLFKNIFLKMIHRMN